MRTVALSLALLGVASALHLRPAKPNAAPATAAELAPPAPPAPVFYMMAMNKLAGKHQTRLWLSSVRKVGKWKGEIVLVTDQAECLKKNLGEELLGGPKMASSTEVMDVFPGGNGMGKVYFLKQPVTSKVKEMKQEKAFAWKNMHKLGLKPSFIVYTDQDIIFGKDVNIVIDKAKANLVGKEYTLALFKDQGVSKGQLHTGIIFIFPGADTDKCLEEWGRKIMSTGSGNYHGFDKHQQVGFAGQKVDTQLSEEAGAKAEAGAMGPDQKALGRTGSCKTGKGIAILEKDDLMMPTSNKLSQQQTATFIHFTNTNRWHSINNDVMKKYFTSVLGLPEQEWFAYEQC